MPDREKVILGIENCLQTDSVTECSRTKCPFIKCRETCLEWLLRSALALLKEQETGVSPKEIKMYPGNVWACGSCGHVAVGSADYKAKYCPECGKPVKWNE